jgi:hypothetical protein
MFLAAGKNGRQVLKNFNELLKFEEECRKDTRLNDLAGGKHGDGVSALILGDNNQRGLSLLMF